MITCNLVVLARRNTNAFPCRVIAYTIQDVDEVINTDLVSLTLVGSVRKLTASRVNLGLLISSRSSHSPWPWPS